MKIFLVVLTVLFIGCSNKNISLNHSNNYYDVLYQKYVEYDKKGYPKYADKIARLIYLQRVKRPPYIERKYALKALKQGFSRDRIYVADSYFKEKRYIDAIKWYMTSNFDDFNLNDTENLMFSLQEVNNTKLTNYCLNLLTKKSNNPVIMTILGKYYLQNPNKIQKALNLLKKAYYDKKFYKAGVILGRYYIQNGKEKKGIKILKDVMYKDANAAYFLSKYFYKKMILNEQQMNANCISYEFNSSKDFYNKKLSIYKYNDLYTRNNIVIPLKVAYKLGKKEALYDLIKLDVEDNTFMLAKNTYSGMDLNQTIEFLKNSDRVSLLLGIIYEKYIFLKQLKKAKEIYIKYKKINNVLATWHLYLYEKQFENKINFEYLNYLVKQNYVPAIIEKAYQESILGKNFDENIKTLFYYEKQNQISAINYIGSLYAKQYLMPKSKRFFYYKKACVLYKKPFFMPYIDIKFANYYLENNQTDKYYAIHKYYSDMDYEKSEKIMAKYYRHNGYYKEAAKLFKKLYYQDPYQIDYFIEYAKLVLKGYVKDDYKAVLNQIMHIKNYKAYLLLGDIYKDGYFVEFSPKKAEEYYMKAYNSGYKLAIFKIINMYKKLNVNHYFDEKIISLYKKAIDDNVENAKLALAKFYFENKEYKKAYEILKTINDNEEAKTLMKVIESL